MYVPHQPTTPPPPDRRPTESVSAEPRSTEPDSTESDYTERLTAPAWSRVVRLGSPRPGPAARHARWLGVPLVPLFLAALVVGGVMAVGGGDEFEGPADGRSGGGPVAGPSPVVTTTDGAVVEPSTPGAGTPSTGTPSTGAPATRGPVTDTPTHTAPGLRPDPQSSSASPQSSRTASTAPAATGSSPTTAPTSTRPPAKPVSFEALRVGDCFDIDRATPGTALRRDCDTPHDAELVTRLRLTGTYADDQLVREAATELCRAPLRDKAARQPLGTRWTTFVQYPYRTSYLLGSDAVACSLAAPSATGRKLTGLLR
ncbi:hypothetical protein GCM10017674_52510 [Streptomyces gardneri]|uniref:Septum formation-related domain-containing protein n=1 Tax=Streptomyces gardneri TaxID=66892 RepID=A0A4Y3REW3_9ACTN|nr:hypothetical protein SGA01_15890 [Streptomyces gardneri]GHH09186.1 hypothetical protein GCM10017674_52510 [Streptomyces gardneri]